MQTKSENRIFVLGAGSLGLFTIYYLQKNDVASILLGRKKSALHFASNKLEVQGLVTDTISISCQSLEDIEPGRIKDTDVVFITCKSTQLESVLIDLKARLGADCRAILVLGQNGIGVLDLAKKILAGTRFSLVRMHYWLGAQRLDIGQLKIAGIFKLDLSAEPKEQKSLERVADILAPTKISTVIGLDPKRAEWQKALWNIAVNGVCSVTNQPNGAILDNKELLHLSQNLVREAKEIAKLEKIDLSEQDIDMVYSSLAKTRGNFNATLQDLRAGRPTEIHFLNGAVVKTAEKHGKNAPFNETITNLIAYLERS